jgi:hypothetical protein
VYALLDDLADHEPFCDHFMVDWSTPAGRRAGVGSTIRARARRPGPADWIDMTCIEAVPGERIVERGVAAKGKRATRGTYTLRDAPGGGTEVRFELVLERAPVVERLLMPLLRPWLAKANAEAMTRLREHMA